MRAVRTNATRCRLSALSRVLLASLAWLCAAGLTRRRPAADEPRQPLAIQFSLDRPIDAAAAPFVLASARGLFSAEALAVTINIAGGSEDAIARVAAGTSDLAVVDINALMRFRDKDKQRGPDQGGVRAVQQGALCHHRPQEPRHPGADRHRGQDARRRRRRPVGPAVAGGGQFERHQAQEREAEQHRRRGARADAVGGPDRCRHRLLLPVGDQSQGSRRAGRRSRRAEIRRLWLRGLWLRRDRQSGAGDRQARGGKGIRAGRDRRRSI